ncbi:SprB repeat-containing protein, partial [Lacibacter sp. H407]|uniref:SprB repeat-containing protein n=1 Tax=Lacibacter sp. H407 TaxID=3133423 RepID=UPI0030BB87ED
PPYTFLWNTGATTEDLASVPAGAYSVTVTDANGCTETANATVNQPTDVTANAVPTPAACNASNGSVNLTVGGGTPPYTFLWNTGATTEDLASVPAGAYSVTVTDANGCTETANATVTAPSDLTANAVPTHALCFGGNGSVNLTVGGGTAPYSFLWNTGATTEDLASVP